MTKAFTALLFLAVSVTLISDCVASQCLPSAAAVRHAFPGSWPSWHRVHGSRCWFAKGHHEDARTVPLPVAARRVRTETVAAPSLPSMAVLGWTFRSRTTAIGPQESMLSFDERWNTITGTQSLGRPSIMQRSMDPIGVVP
jgi:hypothetical protein